MHQKLQVVEGKLLHVLPQLVLLVHALDEEEGLLAYLRGGGGHMSLARGRGCPLGHQAPCLYLVLLMGAEVQQDVEVLELP